MSEPPPPPPESGGSGGASDPILVLVLNLLICGGVGSILLGQKTKGIVAIVAWVILFFVTCGAASGLVALIAAIDGYLQAQQLRQGHPIGEWTFFNGHR